MRYKVDDVYDIRPIRKYGISEIHARVAERVYRGTFIRVNKL